MPPIISLSVIYSAIVAGFFDHADDHYLKRVLAKPTHQWTRLEQIQLYVRKKFPVVAPSDTFIYSDTGYILLGDIIERVTGQSLGHAVRGVIKIQ
ncbi:serine hydrolase [Providencia stuartii]|nr:serine hydrolase [Providencia stuartii]